MRPAARFLRSPTSPALALAAVVLALSAACGGDDDDGPPGTSAQGAGGEGGAGPAATADELLARGPSAVGYRRVEVRYRPAGAAADRVLPVDVWYPARAAGEPPATYAVGGIVSLPATDALAAPAPAEGGPFPLAVYSHGSGGEGLLGYPYAERFASHGWVVASPSHVGNTVLDALAGKASPATLVALDRPRDVTAVIDFFAGGPAGDALAGAARVDRVFLFGHSFGGYTTFTGGGVDVDAAKVRADCADVASCEALDGPGVEAAYRAGFGDPRVAAIAPQAPALVRFYGEGQLASLGVPTLLMSGRLDRTTPDAENAAPAWAGLDHPDDLRVELPQGAHFSFVTICDDLPPGLLGSFQSAAADDGCGPAFTPVAEAVPVLSAYLLGFARWHVLGEARWAPLLRGAPLHPAFVVSTH